MARKKQKQNRRSRKQETDQASNDVGVDDPDSGRPPGEPGSTSSRKPGLRIVGGEFRGRQLAWSGDLMTRPMKDNVRETVFNLVGGWMPGRHVFDLFAGSGAIGLEALSRGASHATLIERHFPTARIIEENIAMLNAGDRATVVTSDTFFWSRQFLSDSAERPSQAWAIFCSPPYEFYVSRKQEMLDLIAGLKSASPPDSVIVVESDSRFNTSELPDPAEWRSRTYAIATISVFRPAGVNRPD